jgi:hypothetical protein
MKLLTVITHWEELGNLFVQQLELNYGIAIKNHYSVARNGMFEIWEDDRCIIAEPIEDVPTCEDDLVDYIIEIMHNYAEDLA